jgi:outer membrane phospholipase A
VQYFNGYGEDILDYNMKRKSQLRIGFAIVP